MTLGALAPSAALISLVFFATHEYAVKPTGALHVFVLDVGQGDAILLRGPSGETVLVDGGPDLSVLSRLPRHLSFFDRTIDLLVVTHPDADHVGGLAEIVKRYDVKAVLMNGSAHSSGPYESFLSAVSARNTPILLADPLKDIRFESGLLIDVVHPDPRRSALEGNNRSIVFRAVHRDESVLLTGDIERDAENEMLASGGSVRADVIKVPHHGSRTSSSTGFLLHVDPSVALVSAAGERHRLNHPHRDVVERYERSGIAVRRTDREGTLEETW